MSMTKGSRKTSFILAGMLLLAVSLLSACAASPASSTSSTPGKTTGTASTKAALVLPDQGVAASIPVGLNPEIVVESGNATQLTFIGSDTENLSTGSYAIPYKKKGNKLLINFGQTLGQPMEIKLPYETNLTVTLTSGNVTVDTIQGQVVVSVNNGTIHLKNFTPRGTDTIETRTGTIEATFAQNASCQLKAQTQFGAIVSGYPAIKEKRDGMKAEASGTISNGSGAMVTLTTESGSITIGPA